MPGISRKDTDTVDAPGGNLIGSHSVNVYVNGQLAEVVTDEVKPHGGGKHNSAHLNQGSSNVFIHGLAVVRQGDSADCGHHVSTASSNVFAN